MEQRGRQEECGHAATLHGGAKRVRREDSLAGNDREPRSVQERTPHLEGRRVERRVG